MSRGRIQGVPVELIAVAEVLRERMGLTDIGVSMRRKELYLLGAPRKLEGLLLNHGHRALWSVVPTSGHDPRWFKVHVWDDLEEVVTSSLNNQTNLTDSDGYGLFSEWAVIPVPKPGLPPGVWFSVRHRKKVKAKKPPVFRACEQEPVPFPCSPAYPQIIAPDFAGAPLMLTHSLLVEELDKVRSRCGGRLLWPSWALSWRVPAGYGDVTFVASPAAALMGLKPLGRRNPRLTVHETDAWSFVTAEVLRWEKGVNRELRGEARWWMGPPGRLSLTDAAEEGYWGQRGVKDNLLITGFRPDQMAGGFCPDEAWEPMTKVTQLRRRMRELVAMYERIGRERASVALVGEGVYARVDLRSEYDDPLYPERQADRYDYIEVKAQGPIPVSELPMVVYPSSRARRVERFLDQVGFEGWRLKVPYRRRATREQLMVGGPVVLDFAEDAEWAHLRTMAILRWADALQRTGLPPRGVAIPEAVVYPTTRESMVLDYRTNRRAWGRSYEPMVEIHRKYDYRIGGLTNADRSGYIPQLRR